MKLQLRISCKITEEPKHFYNKYMLSLVNENLVPHFSNSSSQFRSKLDLFVSIIYSVIWPTARGAAEGVGQWVGGIK